MTLRSELKVCDRQTSLTCCFNSSNLRWRSSFCRSLNTLERSSRWTADAAAAAAVASAAAAEQLSCPAT